MYILDTGQYTELVKMTLLQHVYLRDIFLSLALVLCEYFVHFLLFLSLSFSLQPENLLIDLSSLIPCVKLIDFGDALNIGSSHGDHTLLGNPEFAAPELITDGHDITIFADMW